LTYGRCLHTTWCQSISQVFKSGQMSVAPTVSILVVLEP